MNIEMLNALNRYALAHGRKWRESLSDCWLRASYPSSVSDADKSQLQQLRNNGGPSILPKFRPRTEGYTRVGYLQKTQMEDLTAKGGGFVPAWKLVTACGVDIVQPYDRTKDEARNIASKLGVFIAEELR